MITLEETLQTLFTACDGGTENYEHYNLPVFTIGGAEYAIASDEDEANEACKEYIKETIWAFNADFLSNYISSLDAEDIDALRQNKCESMNEALRKLIDDFDLLCDDAISADGLGHFLSSYDGECLKVGDFHLFRIN
jgi:hypothetical protein